MGPHQNRIVRTARQALGEGWFSPSADVPVETRVLESLTLESASESEIAEAMVVAFHPEETLDFLATVLEVCTVILWAQSSHVDAASLLVYTADRLHDRQEIAACAYAVYFCKMARAYIGSSSLPEHISRKLLFRTVQIEVGARCEFPGLSDDPSDNLGEAVSLCQQFGSTVAVDDPYHAELLILEAEVLNHLACLNVSRVPNLKQALHLYESAQAINATQDSVAAMIGAAGTCLRLALAGEEPEKYVRLGLDLVTTIQQSPEVDAHQKGMAAAQEGLIAIAQFAPSGQLDYLRKAISCFDTAITLFDTSSPNAASARIVSCDARLSLAEAEGCTAKDLDDVISMLQSARQCPSLTPNDLVLSLIGEANARLHLADLGEKVEENILLAEELAAEAAQYVPSRGDVWATVQIAHANILVSMARLSIDPIHNANRAIELYDRACRELEGGNAIRNAALIHSSLAHIVLGDAGIRPVANCRKAIALCLAGRIHFASGHPAAILAQHNEVTARLQMASIGIEPQKHVGECLERLAYLREQLPPRSLAYGRTLRLSAQAHLVYVMANPDAEPTYETFLPAIQFCEEAETYFVPGSLEHTLVTLCQNAAYSQLASIDPDSPDFGQKADQLRSEVLNLGIQYAITRESACLTAASRALTLLGNMDEQDRSMAPRIEELDATIAALAPTSPRLIGANLLKAMILAQEDRPVEAYRCIRSGLDVAEHVRGQLETEEERIAYLGSLLELYHTAFEICVEFAEGAVTPSDKEPWLWEAWQWAYRSKCRALVDVLSNRHLPLGPRDRRLLEEVQLLSGRLERAEKEALALIPPVVPDEDPEEVGRVLANSECRSVLLEYSSLKELYEEKRSQLSARCSRLQGNEVVPEPRETYGHLCAIDRGITSDGRNNRTLFIEFFTSNNIDMTAFVMPLWEDVPPIIVGITLPGGGVRDLITGFLDCTTSPTDPLALRPIEDWNRLLRQIGDYLIVPLEHCLNSLKPDTLVIAPHKLLGMLPIHAAEWQGGPLVEKYAIAYLPSASLAEPIGRAHASLCPTALIVGAPSNDGTEDPLDDRSRGLPYAAKEQQWVSELMTKAGIRVTRVTENDATTEAVLHHADEAGIMHFACHSVTRWDDYLRSGLELTDRRLTPLDLSLGVNMSKTTLTYLNSCNSAESVLSDGDELFSLIRSFLYAGCPTVVAGLWEVLDQAGTDFAIAFYTRWLRERVPLLEAFRAAQLHIRDRYNKHPQLWASFVLVGAWSGRASE